ncbi:MAG: hypothetical protein KGL35_04265 [Bradyrhizobium sp.]|nr:hypothetical protein [Bradyrhizobium sp.]
MYGSPSQARHTAGISRLVWLRVKLKGLRWLTQGMSDLEQAMAEHDDLFGGHTNETRDMRYRADQIMREWTGEPAARRTPEGE